jgi:hypothetical protein
MFRGSALVHFKSTWNLELAQRQGGALYGYSCLRELSPGEVQGAMGQEGIGERLFLR